MNVGLEVLIITISPIIIIPSTSFIGTNGVNVIAVINSVDVLVQLNVRLEIRIPKLSIGIRISSAINIVDSIIDLYKVIHVISSLITWSIIVPNSTKIVLDIVDCIIDLYKVIGSISCLITWSIVS